jgi:signal transduction histidine kinase
LRLRLTVLAGVTISVFSLGFAAITLVALEYFAADYVHNQVTSIAARLAFLGERIQLYNPLPAESTPYVQIVDDRGQVVRSSSELRNKPPMADFRPSQPGGQIKRDVCHSPVSPHRCLFVVAMRLHRPHQDWVIFVGAVAEYVPPLIPPVIIAGSRLLVALTTFMTHRAVAKTIAPVDAIRQELAEITATDLGRRVPVPGGGTEIRALARTANETLDRLEAAVEQQRRFASDASHDLRSPITAMRTQVEEALLAPEETDWPVNAQALLESLDRLQAIVTDLLMIARLDAGARQAQEIIDLGDLVRGEFARRPRRVRLAERLEPGVTVRGDPLRLARLLTNLLDNAERHAASVITVTVRRDAGTCVLEVLDDGAGIPVAQREIVFQRFTRLDAARSRDAGGTGLGLPIARQIAETHGGTLTIEDSPKGARFVLRLPCADTPSESGRER